MSECDICGEYDECLYPVDFEQDETGYIPQDLEE